ncbi:dehydrogenase/reductase SDR family member 4-like [Lineus longissimus]|uniref:dehydrogenase/reductase SDR family member 4-like n=1 Tax=Lineus longissimus TaxID=88925 RepID=UPI002B4EC3CB
MHVMVYGKSILRPVVIFKKLNSLTLTGRMSTVTSTKKGRFDGKVAIVTGSTEGIGLAVARRLAQDGAKVMICSRKEKKVEAAVKQLVAENLLVRGVPCQAALKEDRENLVAETLKHFGGIDFLVNSVGASPYFGTIMNTPEKAYDQLFDLNVKAGFFMSQAVLPHMEKRGGGSIVFNSSITAYSPMELIGVYSVCKTTLLGMAKAMAPELGRSNVRVNCVAPGIIGTKFSKALIENEELQQETMKTLALKRVGTPEDIAGVVAFLCSDDAAYITGETVTVAGGMHSHL